MTAQQLDSRTADRLWADYARTRDPRTRDALVQQFERLAYSVANPFVRRGAEAEDLYQVARMGLVKAVDRFDPGTGFRFSTFAKPKILGEIKRYFRDHSRSFHVPRGLQERERLVARASQQLALRLGHSPTPAEIANHVELSEEQVREALALEEAIHPVSLDGEVTGGDGDGGGVSLAEYLGSEDTDLCNAEARVGMRQALDHLSLPLRQVLQLRFFGELSQREVAARMEVSQMKVSRMEKRALAELRRIMDGAAVLVVH